MSDLGVLVTLIATLATLAHLGASWYNRTIDDRAERIAEKRDGSFEEALPIARRRVDRLYYAVSGLLVVATLLLFYQLLA